MITIILNIIAQPINAMQKRFLSCAELDRLFLMYENDLPSEPVTGLLNRCLLSDDQRYPQDFFDYVRQKGANVVFNEKKGSALQKSAQDCAIAGVSLKRMQAVVNHIAPEAANPARIKLLSH